MSDSGSDRAETTANNPESWIAWKRRAEIAERDLARLMAENELLKKNAERIAQLEKELAEAREAADAYSKGVYSETMLKAAKVIAGGHALQNELLLERDRSEAAEQALALRGEPVAIPKDHCSLFVHYSKECAQQGQCLYAAPISGERDE